MKRSRLPFGISFLTTLLVATLARADEEPAERVAPPPPVSASSSRDLGPRNAISTQPFAFFARGFALSYERLLTPRVSVAGIAGYRSTAQGDFSSNTIHGGVEGRFWVRSPQTTIAMSGPFLGLRLGVGHTTLVDRMDDRRVGSSIAFSPTIDFGWRFVAWRHLEVTPSMGLGVRSDLDPPTGLVSTPRPVLALNLTMGWMF